MSLFTNVPIDPTIDIIIRHIYKFKEINTRITKYEMRELILLCTKGAHFTFGGETFTQIEGVAMASPLAPILTGIFMVKLKGNLIPILKDHLSCFIKDGLIEHVLLTPNNLIPGSLLMKQKVVTSYPSEMYN